MYYISPFDLVQTCIVHQVLHSTDMRGSRNFCQGGPGPTTRKRPGQRVFFSFFFFLFLGLNLFYSLQRGSNGFI